MLPTINGEFGVTKFRKHTRTIKNHQEPLSKLMTWSLQSSFTCRFVPGCRQELLKSNSIVSIEQLSQGILQHAWLIRQRSRPEILILLSKVYCQNATCRHFVPGQTWSTWSIEKKGTCTTCTLQYNMSLPAQVASVYTLFSICASNRNIMNM